MAKKNIYSGMTDKEKENERKYLNNLVSKGGGEGEWAKNQLKDLNAASSSSSSSTPSYNQTWESGGRTYVGGVDVGPAGTRVDTSNAQSSISAATKSNTASGSSYTQPQYDRYQQEYDDLLSEYQAQQDYIREQQRKANEAAVNSGVQRLQNQLTASNQAFDQAGRDAYINAMRNQYTLPNQLNAMGYTGGLSETEAARSRANYANTLADIEQQRALTANETNLAINDLRNQADQRTAEQNAALAQDYIDKIALLKEQSKANEFADWQNTAQYLYGNDYTAEIQRLAADNADGKNSQKIAYLTALRQQKLNSMAEAEDEEWQRKYKEAQLMADLGDYSGLQALGYNVSQQTSTGSGSGSGSGTPKGNGLTYKQLYDELKDIVPSGGTEYTENLAAARLLLNNQTITTSEAVSLMKQFNIRPEMMVREMAEEGYPDEDIIQFIELYTPKQDYRDSLYKYAYNK